MSEDKSIHVSADDVQITWDEEATPKAPTKAEQAAAELMHDAAAMKEVKVPSDPIEALKAGMEHGKAIKAMMEANATEGQAEAAKPVESQGKGQSGACKTPSKKDEESLRLREKWLGEAWERLTGLSVGQLGVSGISCGFGKGGSRAAKGYAIHREATKKEDQPKHQVFVHPTLHKKGEVLKALAGVATELGYKVGPSLEKVDSAMPPYPQHKLAEDDPALKKDGIRQLKVVCPVCGYTARTSRKWLDSAGAPFCPTTHAITEQNKELEFIGWPDAKLIQQPHAMFQMLEADKPIEVDMETDTVKKEDEDILVTTKKQ